MTAAAKTEQGTTERAQRALEEHRAILWEQHQKLSTLLRSIETELAKMDELMRTISPRPVRIIERIIALLEEVKHGLDEDEIVAAMIKVGAAYGRRDPAKQIRDSMSASMAPRNRNPKLKKIGNVVGLAHWQDEKFRT